MSTIGIRREYTIKIVTNNERATIFIKAHRVDIYTDGSLVFFINDRIIKAYASGMWEAITEDTED